MKLVDKNSAILGLPDSREKAVALNANHEEICRFASEENDNYKHVSTLIVDFVNSAMDRPRDAISETFSLVESFDSLNTTLVNDDSTEGSSLCLCECLVDRRNPRHLLTILSNFQTTVKIPYPRNKHFVNRKPAIEQVKERLLPIGESQSRVAIFGLGGVGFVLLSRKSQRNSS